jgi:hypothetical protein
MHFGKPQNDKFRLPEIVGLPMFPGGNPHTRKYGKACPVISIASPDCKNVEFPNGLN